MTVQDTTGSEDRPQAERDAAEESSMEHAADADADVDDPEEEPGATGPLGTGTEGLDDVLEAEREHDGEDGLEAFGTVDDGVGVDDVAAGEQGNREGDEMVSEGDDAREVAELAGDDEDIDAIGEIDEPLPRDALDD